MSAETLEPPVHNFTELTELHPVANPDPSADDIDTLALLDNESLLKRRHALSEELGEVSMQLHQARQIHSDLLLQLINPDLGTPLIGFEAAKDELNNANQQYLLVISEIIRANYHLSSRGVDTNGLSCRLRSDLPEDSAIVQSS